MEFDSNRVYTCVNADELKAGDKVILAHTFAELKILVEHDNKKRTLSEVYSDTHERRFVYNGIYYKELFELAYLIERATKNKYRAYANCYEVVHDIKNKTNGNEFTFVKRKQQNKHYYLITGFKSSYPYSVMVNNKWITLDRLFDEYVHIDDSPCGIEEQ